MRLAAGCLAAQPKDVKRHAPWLAANRAQPSFHRPTLTRFPAMMIVSSHMAAAPSLVDAFVRSARPTNHLLVGRRNARFTLPSLGGRLAADAVRHE